MIQHLTSLPVLLPMLAAIILLLPPCGKNLFARRLASSVMAIITFVVSVLLLITVHNEGINVYAIGNWSAPFGIVLVADMLSSLLVALTSFLGVMVVLYGCAGDDEHGSFFHPLIHFLILGVNGAFLTGDLFNVFVFFEVLLIASYALLMHGGGKQKTKAALHYVILNLVGSSAFLIGLGILYGVLGTLNIADMAQKISLLTGDDVYLAKAGGLLLLVVFALKSALLPLHLWLPNTYSSAAPVVAALFAIMTKVGVYAMLRVYTVMFGEQAGELEHMAQTWLWGLAIATIVVGAIGVLAAQDLRKITANLVLVSVGTLVALVSLQNINATAALLYYLVHSTLVCAALFLLADIISIQRGKVGDRLVAGRVVKQPFLLGTLFIIAALTVIGMPPFSGFVGKIWILKTTLNSENAMVFWPAYLITSLVLIIALARAGTSLFWEGKYTGSEPNDAPNAHPLQVIAIVGLLICSVMLVVFGGAISEYTIKAATQLHDISGGINAVLKGGV
ncbi:multicomponent K+:H+ antiporter subunit D [Pseudoalteromonas translucida KMM 520]|uniref:Multicomponent K+:H+ antiporter subunit D n=1 Tax=Pseudoalteromonas translucida KMM 520 TaxID=1315283 RepID=A0A0U2WVT0_9GAMM|nr:monovalent cation/H+ antiporter subunit D [Pseudoalteromonas translucida]ALS32408.1 multicomponent K+:H+ antiporter subunit D [Pseudoalteromonas translucida KMM 520]